MLDYLEKKVVALCSKITVTVTMRCLGKSSVCYMLGMRMLWESMTIF